MVSVLRWFTSQPTAVQTTIVSAIVAVVTALLTLLVAPVLKYRFDLRLATQKTYLQYRVEQQRVLRDSILRYKGMFLEVAAALSARLWNFYTVENRGWLALDGNYRPVESDRGYFVRSFAYRILAVVAVARLVERESIFVDLSVARKADFELVVALRLVLRSWSDIDLFKDVLSYDPRYATDHFFIDDLRAMADSFRSNRQGEVLLSFDAFQEVIKAADHRYVSIFRYLDGLSRGESRYRFDRLVCAHLVLLAVLNGYGYDYQRTSLSELEHVARHCEHERVLTNLAALIRDHMLDRNRAFHQVITVADRVAAERRPVVRPAEAALS
jgi:hypothetical protein